MKNFCFRKKDPIFLACYWRKLVARPVAPSLSLSIPTTDATTRLEMDVKSLHPIFQESLAVRRTEFKNLPPQHRRHIDLKK
jgi:hypothetical protein